MSQKTSEQELVPVIVDVGKVKKSKVKKLKKGEGPLMDEIEAVVGEVREALAEHVEGKTILPVILVYRQKDRRKQAWLGPFPLPTFYDDDDDDDDDDD